MEELKSLSTNGSSILPKLAPNLSRHMLFQLIQFESELADERGDDEAMKAIDSAKAKLLEDTNMNKKEAEVQAQREKHDQATEKIRHLLTQDEVVNGLRSDKVANLEFLKNQHGVTLEMVDALYDLGQFQFRCFQYGDAADTLYQFRVLSTDNDKVSAATWGRLASEILSMTWDSAVDEIKKVREDIDTRLFNNPRAQLDHRTMLIHWSLFPLFNFEAAREPILDMFFSAAYINTIQTSCPWILRYLVAAVITGRGRARNSSLQQKQLKDVIRYVRQESYEYNDPLTQFVMALYVSYDFNAAREALAMAEQVCRSDAFLAECADAFVESARHLICESYCKIYSRMNMRDLSEKLGLNPDEGEKWIVNLIRETRLDAKIDSQAGTVVMNHPPNNVYQQVIEKTKGGFFRTQVMNSAVSKP